MSTAGERLCSNASGISHTIKYVQYFTEYCRVGHEAWTTRPSGTCAITRCVQFIYASGASAPNDSVQARTSRGSTTSKT